MLAQRTETMLLEEARVSNGSILDGKAYLPLGPEERAREREMVEQLEAEQAIETDPLRFSEREREMLTIRSDARAERDRLLSLADRKARRLMKRDQYVRKAVMRMKKQEGSSSTSLSV